MPDDPCRAARTIGCVRTNRKQPQANLSDNITINVTLIIAIGITVFTIVGVIIFIIIGNMFFLTIGVMIIIIIGIMNTWLLVLVLWRSLLTNCWCGRRGAATNRHTGCHKLHHICRESARELTATSTRTTNSFPFFKH